MIRLVIALLGCSSALAQAPVVGDIEFYGLRSVGPERILKEAGIRKGDPIPPSKGALEDKIAAISGIVLARVEAICCEGRDALLFIGVEERGAVHASFRSAPAGDATLPADLVDAYGEFLTAVQRAAARGSAAEDLTAGHSLMADPAARALQQRFLAFASEHLDLLRSVIAGGSEPDQRAIAAAVIAYAPDKASVVNDIQAALQDPEEPVRANAIRALNAFAVAGVRFSPTWLVELLNSVVMSDRVESVRTLLTVTDKASPETLQTIRDRALLSVVEMARWHSPRYALPPFLLTARLAGVSDEEAQSVWKRGDRESVIQKATGAAGRKKAAALQ